MLTEAEKYQKVWELPAYRAACHSLHLWTKQRDLFPSAFNRALDIGCGLGLLIDLWNRSGYDGWGVDLVSNCLHPKVRENWGHKFIRLDIRSTSANDLGLYDLGRFDLGVCTDVMEHIPPEDVRTTLRNIAETCKEVIFKIAHVPAHPWLGPEEPLHLTIEPVEWWLDQMEDISGHPHMVGIAKRSGFTDSLVRWLP